MDRRALLRAPSVPGTSNPGTIYSDFGGVARNVAQNLAHLGCRVMLCSRVGNDEAGRQVLGQPLDTSLISVSETWPTASYTAILEPSGELVIGLADMDVYEELTPQVLAPAMASLRAAGLWFLDANLPAETMEWLTEAAMAPVAVDAVSVAKSQRLARMLGRVSYLFCNVAQAGALAGRSFDDSAEAAGAMVKLGAQSGIVSAGARGIAVFERSEVCLMPALAAVPRDVTGAGDALVAGTLFGLAQGRTLRDSAKWGLAAAAIAVESANSAAPCLTAEALYARA